MVALALAIFHRFMQPSENRHLLMYAVLQEYVSTDTAGLLKNGSKRIHLSNRVLDEDSEKWLKFCISLDCSNIKFPFPPGKAV